MSKSLPISVLILFFSVCLHAQPAIQWQKSLGGTNYDEAFSITSTIDGGFIVAGSSGSYNGDVSGNYGSSDCWVVKLNAIGVIQWQKHLGGSAQDRAASIASTADGGYIMAGLANSNNIDVSGNHGSFDCWIVKLDSIGTLQWQKSLGGTDDDEPSSIAPTADGGYIMAGFTRSNNGDVSGNHGIYDYWVVKLNAAGTIQWQKTLGGTLIDQARSIAPAADGGYIVAGYSTSTDGDVTGHHNDMDCWIVKLDTAGTIQWQKSIGGTGQEGINSIICSADRGYVMAGFTSSNDGDVSGNNGYYDYWVVKMDTVGTIQWQKTFGGAGDDEALSIAPTPNGGYVVAGYIGSSNGYVSNFYGSSDYWILKLDTTGTINWQKNLGGSYLDIGTSVTSTPNGDYAVAGWARSNDIDISGNHGNEDYWVVKLNCAASYAIDTETACGGYRWLDGHFYTVSTDSPTYTLVGGAVSGCDSIIRLHLTIDSIIDPIITQSAGVLSTGSYSSYTWCVNGAVVAGGTTQHIPATQSGRYTVVVTNGTGCSDTSQAYVVVIAIDTQKACNSYTWRDGHTYTASTDTPAYSRSGSNYDSIITLHLIIDSIAAPVISESGGVLTTGSYSSYEWYLNGSVTGDTTQQLQIDQNGSYTVVVTGTNGCRDSSEVFAVTGVGLARIPVSSAWRLYPNPTAERFVVSLISRYTCAITIQIENMLGQNLRSTQFRGPSQTIDVSDLSTGIYIVRIVAGEEQHSIRMEVVR
ncbi:MAG: T9SS type A sorting domain-containing protein [Bacteroidetes bacterium]|nr:T9SS type A sorting domain-containing protein [Bacteroidota bacterium]